MQSPGLLQKQPVIRGNRSVRAKNVIQGRDPDPIGMTALGRLFELSRISQQNQATRSLRDGKHVCERHLRSLVDEEYVDAETGVRARPEE